MDKNIFFKSVISLAVMLLASYQLKAQDSDARSFDISGQWQFNAPLNNDFSDKASGWGANVEGYYHISNKWAVGAFMSWNTNNEYVPRRTHIGPDGAVNLDSQNSLFQLPFGLGARYKMQLANGNVVPFLGVKLGAKYARQRQYSNIFGWEEDKWGFYASPEIGVTVYPLANKFVGFNLAGYYSYSTNKFDYLSDTNGLNNIGFRVGVVFKIK